MECLVLYAKNILVVDMPLKEWDHINDINSKDSVLEEQQTKNVHSSTPPTREKRTAFYPFLLFSHSKQCH